MKTVLADDEAVDTSTASFPVQITSAAGWIKRLLRRCLARRSAAPWNRGYDAFYDIRASNPYEADSAAFLEWEQGRKAAGEDFEW